MQEPSHDWTAPRRSPFKYRRECGGTIVVGLGTDGGQESLSTAGPGVDL